MAKLSEYFKPTKERLEENIQKTKRDLLRESYEKIIGEARLDYERAQMLFGEKLKMFFINNIANNECLATRYKETITTTLDKANSMSIWELMGRDAVDILVLQDIITNELYQTNE